MRMNRDEDSELFSTRFGAKCSILFAEGVTIELAFACSMTRRNIYSLFLSRSARLSQITMGVDEIIKVSCADSEYEKQRDGAGAGGVGTMSDPGLFLDLV